MKIKLGIAPIAWSNDDMPELGGDTPIEKCLGDARISGFSGIELGGKFPRNPGIIKFLLEKFELKMPGGWYGSLLRERSTKEEWLALQDHLKLLKLLIQRLLLVVQIMINYIFQLKKIKEAKKFCYKMLGEMKCMILF